MNTKKQPEENVEKVKRNILLNPGPATTTDTVKYALVVPDICPREKEFGKIVEEILVDLVRIVNGEKQYKTVIFCGSGTASIDACINSVVPAGKKILVVSNGAYGNRMIRIAENYGIGVVKYEIPYGDFPRVEEVEKLVTANRASLTHLAVVHHETTTGMLNPVEDLLTLCRKYDLEIILDTISSYAGIPIDLEVTDYDYIISTSNKNIQGIAGLSFVICKAECLNKSARVKKRSFYLDLYRQYEFFKERGEMQFTPPVQIFYALRQAIREYFAETGAKRYERYCKNWHTLIAGLKRLGFQFLLPEDQQSRLLTAVLAPRAVNYRFEEMHDYLYQRNFTIYPGKDAKKSTFRIANIGDIYPADITAFLGCLEEYLRLFDIKEF